MDLVFRINSICRPGGPEFTSLMTLRGASRMSDIAYIGLTVVVFALLGLAAKGVGRL